MPGRCLRGESPVSEALSPRRRRITPTTTMQVALDLSASDRHSRSLASLLENISQRATMKSTKVPRPMRIPHAMSFTSSTFLGAAPKPLPWWTAFTGLARPFARSIPPALPQESTRTRPPVIRVTVCVVLPTASKPLVTQDCPCSGVDRAGAGPARAGPARWRPAHVHVRARERVRGPGRVCGVSHGQPVQGPSTVGAVRLFRRRSTSGWRPLCRSTAGHGCRWPRSFRWRPCTCPPVG